MLAAQQNRETLGIARAIRRVRTSTFSKACGWMDVEKTVPGSEQLQRLASGSPHLGHVRTGVEQLSLRRHSGARQRTGGPRAIDLCSY